MSSITRIITQDSDDVARFTDDSWWLSLYIGAVGYTGAGVGREAGMLFRDIPIYRGSKINSAKITFNSFITRSAAIDMRMYGEANSFPNTFTNNADFIARQLTTNYADWNSPPEWTVDTDYDYTGLASIVQEIVNRNDWGYGNNMAFFWKATSTSGSRYGKSYTDSTTLCPRLTIDYDNPPGISSIHDYGFRISKDGHDVKTCEDKDCVMTSSLNSFKIPTTLQGSTTLAIPANSQATKTIAHNLGYIPAYEAWYKDAGLWRTATSNPGIAITAYHDVEAILSKADSTNLYMEFTNLNDTTEKTISIYYIIFLERLL